MKHASLLLIASALIVAPFAVSAQPVAPPSVAFTATATMPTLKDPSKKDTFVVTLADTQVQTKFELLCSAGRTTLLILRQDKACGVSGSGAIINPSTNQALPRTQYSGGYTVKSDGTTEGSTLSVNYLAVGRVAASSETFNGSMNLRPEVTSSGASALRDAVLKKFNADANGSVIDQRVDTVDLNRLYIPSAGLPSDKGCVWSGNMVFAYQTDSWFLSLNANCDGKEYAFKGNMPWTDSPGVETSLPTFHRLTRSILRTPEEGADTIVWLAATRPAAPAFWFDRAVAPEFVLPWTRHDPAQEDVLLARVAEAAERP